MMTEHAFKIEGEDRRARWLFTCDHASNHVPDFVGGGTLGLPQADMERHIAYDVGIAGVTQVLAEALDATAIYASFSRLVIDPNRGLDDPTLVMRLYDGSIIPTNRNVTRAEIAERIARCYTPYHDELARLAARREDTIYVAMHSFTPRFNGRAPRPWHIGLLTAQDRRLAAPLLELLQAEPDLCVGENVPYTGHLAGDSVDRHALTPGRPNVLIEIRNDLIRTAEQQAAWAHRLAPMLQKAAEIAGI